MEPVTTLSQVLLAMHAQNTELATLVTRLGYLQLAAVGFMVLGFVYIAVLTHRVSAESKDIAAQTAELLRRTP